MERGMDGGTHIEGKGIQSIDVGFRLVRALVEAERPLPLKALAAANIVARIGARV